ncbi:MAG: thymidylate synthase [Agathobacter sp.]|nr:thymidylate synthase [Agathobacter sp.]
MSYADQVFVCMCRDILEEGTSTEGEKVRPHWEDGTSAYTIKRFGVVNRYDLSKEFPAITLRKTYIKSATEEMLWIYQRKSNNIHNLQSTVWDEWADEDGSIGKAYGYQIGSPYIHHTADEPDETLKEKYPSIRFTENTSGRGKKYNVWLDQMDAVIWDLRNTPFSRRIITTTWNVAELHEMNLQPCAYSMTYNVTQKKGDDKLTLNAVLNQRSQDVLAANNWNVCQYAVLLHMVAQVCDMKVGELVHVIADAHIYDRHVPIVEELIQREQHPAPKFWLNPEIKDFYKFTKDDIKISDYETGEQIKDIPIAI